MKDNPYDIMEYLKVMIHPGDRVESTHEGGKCVYLHVSDPDNFEWSEHGDSSVHGMVVESGPVKGQASWIKEAMRVMKPGAHLMMVSNEEEPTGHTGACLAEEAGFEIRDCILSVGEGDQDLAHYIPKASTSERELGLESMKARMYAMSGGATNSIITAEGEGKETTEYGGKGSVGLNKVSIRRNFHPTVKPVGIMMELLKSVERKGAVLDPFMGSGTTGIACLRTDHDFVGIEREAEYFPIAVGRVRYWATLEDPTKPLTIRCDGEAEEVGGTKKNEDGVEVVTFLEIFGI